MVQAIEVFLLTPNECSDNSEMSVNGLTDAFFRILVMFLHESRERNVSTKTSGSGRPDYSIGHVFFGEEKCCSTYRQGVSKLDPVLDLLSKQPWDEWHRFYSDAPFIFAYTCIFGSKHVHLTVGILQMKTRTFERLFEFDLARPDDRPRRCSG